MPTDMRAAQGPSYPEHEKLKMVKDFSQKCGEFMEWLATEKNYAICELDDEGDLYMRIHVSKEKLLAEFFEIDLDKIETEKRQMIEHLRLQNQNRA